MTTRPVYLDYHATTPVDPRVLEAMLPYFTEVFGNPHSRQHAWGWEAEKAVDAARAEVAALINASAQEIIFTGGATESNNLALRGMAERLRDRGNRIVTVATEHKSVLDTCLSLRDRGFEVEVVDVTSDGFVDLDRFRAALAPGAILVSVMAANNEIGTVQPLGDLARLAHEAGALFHTDAAQGAGKVPIDVRAMEIDLLSMTAHKFYGPKGCGALFVRRQKPKMLPVPLVEGGGQENGVRSGTLNVPGIVGLAKAAEICRTEMPAESARMSALRNRLLEGLRRGLDGVRVNGTMAQRLPHNLHVSFDGVEGEALLMALGDLAVSTGSACSSGSQAPSHVLKAIGAIGDRAGASVRFGLGRGTTDQHIEFAIDRVVTVVKSLRRSLASSAHSAGR